MKNMIFHDKILSHEKNSDEKKNLMTRILPMKNRNSHEKMISHKKNAHEK